MSTFDILVTSNLKLKPARCGSIAKILEDYQDLIDQFDTVSKYPVCLVMVGGEAQI
jgi:hypothetical protein